MIDNEPRGLLVPAWGETVEREIRCISVVGDLPGAGPCVGMTVREVAKLYRVATATAHAYLLRGELPIKPPKPKPRPEHLEPFIAKYDQKRARNPFAAMVAGNGR